jgi:integrator complex subunit 12
MSMSATTELDPTFRNALKLLHSSKSDSAEKLRNSLDEIIKTKFGSSKMLINTLSKKHLAEEAKSTGSNLSVKPKPLLEQKKLASLQAAAQTSSPQTVEGISVASSQSPTILSDIDQVQEELMEDLLCVVCRRMDNSAKNCLVECSTCHSLYHQECHKPQISETDGNDQENSWYCASCKNKESIEIDSSPSKSSTSSDSTRHKKKKESSSKHYDSSSSESSASIKIVKKSSHKSSSHSSSHKKSSSSRDGGNGGRDGGDSRSSSDSRDKSHSKSSASASSGTVTPSINIVSADKRLQIMKKKAAKMNETKRKHK